MTAYTGSWLVAPRLGRQDTSVTILGSVAWSGAALASGDTLTIADLSKLGDSLIVEDFEVFGTLPDTNATQTFGLKIGPSGDDSDDDGLLVATVINQRAQLFLKGNGAFIGSGTIDGANNLVATVTANCATGVTSGTMYFKLQVRSRV